ncbi:hypothetical protein [Cognatiyoonia sp. IB215182]|uniref:hypothetical protein n=1 Tax=Cognatiyoonia sp. IB215182 TaxID=3097353 RepID=UPI002A11D852|nr:hypothetical protein [Cognatiyoonia sp. IB215182]MDX8355261.1 hypothetical protein [Cognatiyoonia sp. IB215182]
MLSNITGGGIVGSTGMARAMGKADKHPSKMRRRGDRGIILITTLLLLTLLAGFALAAQNRALSQATLLDRVMEREEERIALQSVRAVALPLIGEALLNDQMNSQNHLMIDVRKFRFNLRSSDRADWFRVFILR